MSLSTTLRTSVIGAPVVGRALLCPVNYESMLLIVGKGSDEDRNLGSGDEFGQFHIVHCYVK